jgi:hypothetical protein
VNEQKSGLLLTESRLHLRCESYVRAVKIHQKLINPEDVNYKVCRNVLKDAGYSLKPKRRISLQPRKAKEEWNPHGHEQMNLTNVENK